MVYILSERKNILNGLCLIRSLLYKKSIEDVIDHMSKAIGSVKEL